MPQFVASLTDDARVAIYDCNMFYNTGHRCFRRWNKLNFQNIVSNIISNGKG